LTYRKKLIEVALPLDAIDKESAREKSIRHGRPSTLRLWWARRPLAACRAMLVMRLAPTSTSYGRFAGRSRLAPGASGLEQRAKLFVVVSQRLEVARS
jgi:adenine-specific DNA methylase